MSIVRQPAYIAKSPISIAIGGTASVPFPVTPIVPTQDFQYNNALAGTSSGKWVSSISYASTGPTSFEFSDLEGVTGNFFSGTPNTLTSISAPNLIYVGGIFIGNSVITSVNVPKLQFLGAANGILANLTSLSLPSLIASESLNFLATSLTSLDISKLQYAGTLNFATSGITSLNLSSLVYAGSFSMSLLNCTTLTLPPLGTWKALNGNLSLSTCAFNQASVNSLLAALAYMDGNNGTLLFGTGRAVTITGTSSAPSNLGVVTGLNGSQFVGAGAICTATIANHGYAIGDVIRVAGVGAPLGNANRYAVILSSGFTTGQFQYTITSQTGTGTGTGTVSVTKAGASAAALVNRGATLTTN
jgi:hypothetical protein